jgi:hypothetical protein
MPMIGDPMTKWPAGVDCLVLPGVPRGESRLADGRGAYPDCTTDLVKLLREQGLQVGFAQERSKRALTGRKSEELLMPILVFARDALANGAGSLLAAAIADYVGRSRLTSTRLQARIGRVKTEVGEAEFADFDGNGEYVVKAIEAYLDGSRQLDPPSRS